MKKYCNQCSKVFTAAHASSKYCSQACSSKAQESRLSIKCSNCSSEIKRKKSHVTKFVNHFCSRKCLYNFSETKVGETHGRLTAVKSVGYKHKKHYWLWNCNCGKEVIASIGNVRSGAVKSCGCYRKTHGLTNTKFHKAWAGMKSRTKTTGIRQKYYKNYAGRGISICKRWKKFNNFQEDMELSYWKHVFSYGEKQTTLDRINNNGNYEPNNCRWATWKEQMHNQRTSKTRYWFMATAPGGKVYQSNNQAAFAKNHGLWRQNISNCLNNRLKTHAGWTFKKLAE